MNVNIKHVALCACLCLFPTLLFTGCLKEGTDTIVLPMPDGKIPTSVIAQRLQDSLRSHGMNIYEGVTPPNIEGRYVASPMRLTYASDHYANLFYDTYMTFSEQNARGLIRYAESQSSLATATSVGAGVIGADSNFTMYCIADMEGDSAGVQLWRCTTATVVSGTRCTEGLRRCQYAFIMLSKTGIDAYHDGLLPDADTYRIFYDGDSLANQLNELLP